MSAAELFGDVFFSLSQLMESLVENQATIELLVTALILIVGFGLAKLVSRLLRSLLRRRAAIRDLSDAKEGLIRLVRYTLMTLSIVAALLYLQTTSVEGLSSLYSQLPMLISLVLIAILGITVIALLTQLIETGLDKIGLTEYLRMYNRDYLVEPTLMIIRIVLYLFLLEIVLAYIGIKFTPASTVMLLALYMAIIALGFLAVFGLRNQAENFFASIYLHSLEYFKVGHRITFEGNTGEIRDTTAFHTEIHFGKDKVLLVPNKTLAKSELSFERKYPEVDTLENIKRYYVAQKPSYCGPAATEMVLRIFGFETNQKELGKLCKTKVGLGTHPQVLINVVEKFTKKKVLGAWVSFEYITQLDDELETWLDQGALTIVDFKKDYIFPQNRKAHYAVCLGVKDDELLILDPGSTKGGVYLVSAKKILRGMDTYSRLIKGKRGYIIFAHEGTKAYWRLKNNLIYSDLGLYEDLSKALESQFIALLKKKRFNSLMPGFVKKFLKNWEKSEETIYRLWHPEDEKIKVKRV